MARFRRSFRGVRRKRNLIWHAAIPNVTSTRTTNGTTETVVVAASDLTTMTDPTLIRCRGNVTVRIASLDLATSHSAYWSMGLILEDEDSTTPPDLTTTAGQERDWIWKADGFLITPSMAIENTTGTEAAVRINFSGLAYERVEIDARAKRKIKRYEHLILCQAVSDITAATQIDFSLAGLRALFQE